MLTTIAVAPPLPTHAGFVGVGLLRVDPLVCDDVAEGQVHGAPRAAVVPEAGGAVHQVLRAEVHQLPRGLGQLALQGPHGTEGPARPTGALAGGEGEMGSEDLSRKPLCNCRDTPCRNMISVCCILQPHSYMLLNPKVGSLKRDKRWN